VENIVYQDMVTYLMSFAVNLLVSPLIGIMFGFTAGLASRFANHVIVVEPLIFFVFGYLSFYSAEMFHLSGILSYVTFYFSFYFT